MTRRILISLLLAACMVFGLVGAVGAIPEESAYPNLENSYWEGRASMRVVGLDASRTGVRVRYAAMVVYYQAFDDSFVLYHAELNGVSWGPGAFLLLWEARNGPYDEDGNCTNPPDYVYPLVGMLGPDSVRRPYLTLWGLGGRVDWTDPMSPDLVAWGNIALSGRLRWHRVNEDWGFYRAKGFSALAEPLRPHELFEGRMNLKRLYVGEGPPPEWLDWIFYFLDIVPEGVWETVFGQDEPLL